MVIFIVLFVCAVVFTGWAISDDWDRDLVGLGAMTSWVFLVIALLVLGTVRVSVSAEIAEYHAVKDSIQNARNGSDWEKAAMAHKIIETNKWLAENKWYNQSIFDVFIPDEIDTLELLK